MIIINIVTSFGAASWAALMKSNSYIARRKMMKKTTILFGAFTAGLVLSTASAAEGITVYGKANVSVDHMNLSAGEETAVASNSSRIGFKGDKALNHGFTGVWKFENEIDVMAEEKPLSARNRYLGLKHDVGTVLVGYHDTPYKSFGGKAGVFHDSIGERRGILGAGNGDNKFNTRAKNSVLYISPKVAGIELQAMGSSGDDNDKDASTAGDSRGMKSFSLLYSGDSFYAGLAYEDQKNLTATQGTGTRAGFGAKFGGTAINAMYEILDSKLNEFTRNAYGLSVVQKIGDLSLKAQTFIAEDYKDVKDSGALLYAVGADYKLDKDFTLYAIYAAVDNKDKGKYVLAGSGHGEKYKPNAAGDDLSGFSMGMTMSF
ncbi:MAG: porin [Gammaproteobacteria bacterium]|nr:porin [Gammaproteobacteria bacterium]